MVWEREAVLICEKQLRQVRATDDKDVITIAYIYRIYIVI